MGFGVMAALRTYPDRNNAAQRHIYEKLVDNIAASNEFQIQLKAALKIAFEDPKSFYDDSGDISLSDRGLSYPGIFVDAIRYLSDQAFQCPDTGTLIYTDLSIKK